MMPASLWHGQALAAKSETEPAQAAFREARQALEEKMRASREPAGIHSYLSLASAGLGEKEKALQAGRRAVELLPMSQDVLGGSWYLYQLAEVEAQSGESDSAHDHMEQLLAAPADFFISEASVRTDPAWDALRQNPRFQRLVAPKP